MAAGRVEIIVENMFVVCERDTKGGMPNFTRCAPIVKTILQPTPLAPSALFAERNRRGREGRQGRPSAGELKQESALVTLSMFNLLRLRAIHLVVC
jgi:hypothetical protein